MSKEWISILEKKDIDHSLLALLGSIANCELNNIADDLKSNNESELSDKISKSIDLIAEVITELRKKKKDIEIFGY